MNLFSPATWVSALVPIVLHDGTNTDPGKLPVAGRGQRRANAAPLSVLRARAAGRWCKTQGRCPYPALGFGPKLYPLGGWSDTLNPDRNGETAEPLSDGPTDAGEVLSPVRWGHCAPSLPLPVSLVVVLK